MGYKISKEAATELKELLVQKDIAKIVHQWSLDRDREGKEVTPAVMAKRFEAKLQIFKIDIRLHEEFGIKLFPLEKLNEWVADYSELLENVVKRENRRSSNEQAEQ